jgi:hypothetical protein
MWFSKSLGGKMFTSSAPYVVTILFSLMTWAFTNFYNNVIQTPFLYYSHVDNTKNGITTRIYEFKNMSKNILIKNLKLTIKRSDFSKLSLKNANVQSVTMPPWGMGVQPDVSDDAVVQFVILPVGQSFKIAFQIDENPYYLFYRPLADNMSNIRLVSGCDFEMIAANYYTEIIFIFCILAIVLLLLIYSLSKKQSSQPEIIKVEIVKGA